MIAFIILLVLWFTICALGAMEYFDDIRELNSESQTAVLLIFIIFGPAFAIANVGEFILNCFMPEGWDDNNDHISKC